jgi:wyosine [tRNA(Phe)-imidazoG37] synthetase (radical SAM superfamily)
MNLDAYRCRGAEQSHGVPDPGLARMILPGHRLIYFVLSQRAGGLSIGVNLNPDKRCNFNCIYCEVDRSVNGGSPVVPVRRLVREFCDALSIVRSGRINEFGYRDIPEPLLELKEVALSGDGEPTLCPNFTEVVTTIVAVRRESLFSRFKIVLITNATGLRAPAVREGISCLEHGDEVWAKLDAGTEAQMKAVNRTQVPLATVLRNIRDLGRERPVIIQSLFPLVNGIGPSSDEVEAYALRLRDLALAGAQIPLVQIYSAHRPTMDATCSHLPLRVLSRIAARVREVSGLRAEVF